LYGSMFNFDGSHHDVSRWDANWYKSIVDNGYQYDTNNQSNVAFFPLFPFIWKLLSCNAIIMSIFNYCIFLMGFIILRNTFKFDNPLQLILLSTGSFFFFMIPYSESLFFFGSTLILIGLHKDNTTLTTLGIFIACTTRSVSIIFIPLFIFTELLTWDYRSKKRILLYTTITVISTLIVVLIQWFYTGEWFAFMKVQSAWHRVFTFPVLPFTTWDGFRLLWLDGLALYLVYISFLLAIYKIVNKNFKNIQPLFRSNKSFVFSIGYMVSTGLTVLFFTSLDARGMSTLYSLNRFIFATSFFIVIIYNLYQNINVNPRTVFFFLLITISFWLLFEKQSLQYTITYYGMIIMYLLLYFFCLDKKFSRKISIVVYFINLFVMLILFSEFTKGTWIG